MSLDTAEGQDVNLVLSIDNLAMSGSGREALIIDAVEGGRCYVARVHGKVVGFAILGRFFEEFPFLTLLIVDEGFRRQGVGTALMQHIESLCLGEKLFTSTNESNQPMQALLASRGYEKSGYVENLDDDDPEIIYLKRL
jgi:ribosomal protein S18 acetylase RimI-like enzyme